jgi:hypothetical protein
MRKLSILIVLPLSLAMGGCNLLVYPAYVLFGGDEISVKAQYKGLKDKRIAILVVSRPAFDFEYPYASTNIGLAGAHTISQHVKGVSFVEQDKIQDFQLENLSWLSMPVSQIAKQFDAQRLIYIDLYEFSMYEQGSINLLRGQISAEVRIFEMESPTPDIESYKSDIKVLVPHNNPIPASEDALYVINQQSIMAFAEKLAWKFYDHKESTKQ